MTGGNVYGPPLGLQQLFDVRRRRQTLLGSMGAATQVVKRKAFFSFHFDDIFRVNVVRNAWKIDHPDNSLMRSFYDSSLWESKKLEGAEAVKELIRDGVGYTSAVCVLIGTDTWSRRWVRYEVARAIVDGRGLLAVHLNCINHHQTKCPHPLGLNPLAFMGIGNIQQSLIGGSQYYLCEYKNNGWVRYNDYTMPVKLPAWLSEPAIGHVTPLASAAGVYDFVAHDGHKNIGAWIDNAASQAGR